MAGFCTGSKMSTMIFTKAGTTIQLITMHTCDRCSLFHNDKLCNQTSATVDINTTEALIMALYSLGAAAESIMHYFQYDKVLERLCVILPPPNFYIVNLLSNYHPRQYLLLWRQTFWGNWRQGVRNLCLVHLSSTVLQTVFFVPTCQLEANAGCCLCFLENRM